ncbi:MAG TPA: 4-hydroxy-3-methylbut-2-enyl diphosphate reductase [Candidatus Moranbacteria bacterium]|nr:4-hydroxy-3-methylbut-2-enyl diphosphate reductase [Candidatus Moranbacteria bacterium]
MKINLSQFAGFCSGVERAYEIVSALDISKVKKPIYILGSLVHNPEVIRRVEKKGIKKIDYKKLLHSKVGEIGTLIITAHGVGPEVFEIAKKKKIEIIDTTCPKVAKVQRLAQVFSKRKYKIILIGDKGHKEVEGINSWGEKKAKIISSKKDLGKLKFSKNEKIAVISQTTQDIDFFEKAGKFIKKKNSKAEIFSTICYTTHDRQEEIKKMAEKNEAVIVIGSKESANSTRLFEIAKEKNPKTYSVENAGQLKKTWFWGTKKVFITAGASTPSWIIKEVAKKLAFSL